MEVYILREEVFTLDLEKFKDMLRLKNEVFKDRIDKWEIIIGTIFFVIGIALLVSRPEPIVMALFFGVLMSLFGFILIIGFSGSVLKPYSYKYKSIYNLFIILYFLPLVSFVVLLSPILIYQWIISRKIKMKSLDSHNIHTTLMLITISFSVTLFFMLVSFPHLMGIPDMLFINLHVFLALVGFLSFNYLSVVLKYIHLMITCRKLRLDDSCKTEFLQFKEEWRVFNFFACFLFIFAVNIFDVSYFLNELEQVILDGINVAIIIYIAFDLFIGKWKSYVDRVPK